jgi:type IV pilus assembly protein PilC
MARVGLPSRTVVVFTRQLATLLQAGVPISSALECLTGDPDCVEVIWTLNDSLGNGQHLSMALAQFPRTFPEAYVQMVRVGESSGALTSVLQQLADWLERDVRIKMKIQSVLIYPAFVLTVAAILTVLLGTTVLAPFLADLGAQVRLPWYTSMVLVLSQGLGHPGVWVGAAAILVITLKSRRRFYKPEYRRRVHRVVMAIPVLGRAVQMAALARFAAAAETLLGSGCGYRKSWQLAARSCGDPLLAADAAPMLEAVEAGVPASAHMSTRPDLYLPILVQMIRAGEETAQLPEMLSRMKTYFDNEVDYHVEALGAVIEPALLLLVAGICSFILISVFVPLYSHLSTLT